MLSAHKYVLEWNLHNWIASQNATRGVAPSRGPGMRLGDYEFGVRSLFSSLNRPGSAVPATFQGGSQSSSVHCTQGCARGLTRLYTLNPEPLNPKPLNPKTLNLIYGPDLGVLWYMLARGLEGPTAFDVSSSQVPLFF